MDNTVKLIEVNGVKMTLLEFEELKNNSNIRIKEVGPNVYKTLSKMYG